MSRGLITIQKPSREGIPKGFPSQLSTSFEVREILAADLAAGEF
jgi:hypothetical protein